MLILAVVVPLELLISLLDYVQLLRDFGHLDLGQQVVPLLVRPIDLVGEEFQLVVVTGRASSLSVEPEASSQLNHTDLLEVEAMVLEQELPEFVFPTMESPEDIQLAFGMGKQLDKDIKSGLHIVFQFADFKEET